MWGDIGEYLRTLYDERIIKYSRPSLEHDCIIWTASCSTDGIPQLISVGKQTFSVPRYVLERNLGRKIKNGLLACHTCDNINGPCINENHIYEGTYSDNTRDMLKRGRHISQTNPNWYSRGTQLPQAKLTEKQVLEIDALLNTNMLQTEIAKLYNTSPFTVSSIKHRKRWKHLFVDESRRVYALDA